jgi:putative ABC transport system substrate-binding protein
LVRLRVDVIVTVGESAALVAKRATATIPIVATDLKQDPVKAGLVAGLGRPGGNVTGLSSQSDELWEKRLGLLKEATPRVSRIIVVSNGMDPGNASCPLEIRRAARGLGLEVVDLGASREWGLARETSIAPHNPGDAVAVCWDDATLKHAQAIAEYGLTHKLATVAPLREYVKAGVLLAFGADLSAQSRRAAYYVDRILKGTKPTELPIERPALFELSLNLKTARMLDVALPPALIVLADNVIQ